MGIERRQIDRGTGSPGVAGMRTARVTLASLLLAVGLLAGSGLTIPRVAVACSCMGPQPLAAYVGPDNVIVAGTVVADGPEGIRLGVEQWFAGEGAAPALLVEGDFGNGASCGIGVRPAVGTRWIGVLWRPAAEGVANPLEDRAVFTSICQPFADLATPEGEALLAEAVATFGNGGAVPTAATGGTETPEAPLTAADPLLLGAVAAAILVGVLILGAAVLVGSRRGRGAG